MDRSKKALAALIFLLAILLSKAQVFSKDLAFQMQDITLFISPSQNKTLLSHDGSFSALDEVNWIISRSAVSSHLSLNRLIVSNARHVHQFQLSSFSQDYGCNFVGQSVSVKILDEKGNEKENVLIKWKSPAGEGLFYTKLGTPSDIPLY